LVIAFSGGPDSTALLLALQRLAPAWRLELYAVHVDHRLDSDSRRRARGPARIAQERGGPAKVFAAPQPQRAGQGVEAAGRTEREPLLERERERLEAA
jgi:tRNA(Ile)-lysidine synthase